MANIGLVTFTRGIDNYGQVLQALATQDYLQKRGHDVFLIRHREGFKEILVIIIKRLIKYLRTLFQFGIKKANQEFTLLKSIDEKRADESELLHPRELNKFRESHFAIIRDTDVELKETGITVLCSGSDQIWAGRNKFYFLRIGHQSYQRIAIAPSTGNRPSLVNKDNSISKWLMDYDFITTREESGVEFCKVNDYEHAHRVLDPSFLMTAGDYDLLSSKDNNVEDYILLYMLKSEISISYDEILSFAKSNNLQLKYVTGQGKYDKYDKIYATMPEWISLLRDAKYVITNSFHGMVLSIIYKKKFLILPLTGKVKKSNERIENVVKDMSLEDRVYNGDLSKIFNDIDYRKSELVIQKNKVILDSLMQSANL